MTARARPVPARRYASPEEVAALLGVTPQTVRRFVSAGELTGYRLGRRMIRLDLAEVDALLRPIPTAARPRRAGGDDA